jgi:multidrug transporter EmrE-like cation transporter
MTICLVLICILLETLEQIAFKASAEVKGLKSNLFVARGIACYCLHMTIWFWLLAHLPLGIALPLMGLSYATVALASRFLFQEHLCSRRWLGIGLIIIGFSLVGWTSL